MLRPTLPLDQDTTARWAARDATPARVHLAAGAAGPIGGDQQRLDVDVGPGSALILGEISPTLLLPGPHDHQSRTEINLRVGTGATLAWLPQLLIAAHQCRHRADIHVDLAPEARLLLREEVLFGRHDEPPGNLRQRIRVVLGDRCLYDQELAIGPDAPEWASPPVTADQRSVGSLLVVDPTTPNSECDHNCDDHSAIMPLPGPGAVATALAADTATLRRQLTDTLTHLLTPANASTTEQEPGTGPVERAPRGHG